MHHHPPISFSTDLLPQLTTVHHPLPQMRFPTAISKPPPGKLLNYPVGSPHRFTLLDGEMVVDRDEASGTFVRRWVVYMGGGAALL